MSNDKLEQELRVYFRCEAEAAVPPLDWWQTAVATATAAPCPAQRAGLRTWARNMLGILRINPEKPFWGVATMVVVLFMFGVVSFGAGIIMQNDPFSGGVFIPPGTTGVPPVETSTIPPTPSVTSTITSPVPPMTIGQPGVTMTNPAIVVAQASSNISVVTSVIIFILLVGATLLLLVVTLSTKTGT